MSRSRWHVLPQVPHQHWLNASGFPPLVNQLLYHRGITEQSQLESFLAADERLSASPFLLPNMHQAVGRIYQALLSGETIAIYGDFDTDGVTSTAVLVQGLALLNCEAIPYIPHRLTEGYGLNNAALENLRHQGASLVITADCGITGVAEIKRANRLGLDVIITDHHLPPEVLPPAVAIVNPKLVDSKYPFPDLAGVGVALKLLQALFISLGKEAQLDEVLDLVALGTIADMAPLVGENRYLVKRGLKMLNAAPRLGLREIVAQRGMSQTIFEPETISWVIAPRLNAAGRLEHAMSSYRLLTTDSAPEAQELARWLEQKNTERQSMTSKALTKAREKVLEQGIAPVLIASDEDFPAGINGLVASRLSEEFYRPAIVIKRGDQFCSGSCRSIPEFNIVEALNQCASLFTHFGGHAQAAGFSLLTRNLPYLQEALLQLATTQLDGVDLRPRLNIDAEVRLSDLGGNVFPTIQKLAPFGAGNPLPTFLSRKLEVVDCRPMGNNGGHVRLRVRQGNMVWDAVGFGLANDLTDKPASLDLVYNLEIDRWNGDERLRLNILDLDKSTE